MKLPCRLLVVLCIATSPAAAVSEEDTPPKLDAHGSPSLARQAYEADWWRAEIVWGRLRFTSARLGTVVDAASAGGCVESLELLATSPEVAIAFRSTRAGQAVTVEVHRNGGVALTRQYGPHDRRTAFSFTQPAEGPVSAQLDTASGSELFDAATLWHLWLSEPELCREQLAPLLAVIDPAREIEQKVAAVETELHGLAAARPLGARSEWTAWVDALSADGFHRREEAHAALLAAGPAILWHLDRWSKHPSAERRHRLARVCRALKAHPADATPTAAAAWLAGDPNIASTVRRTRSSPGVSASYRTGSDSRPECR